MQSCQLFRLLCLFAITLTCLGNNGENNWCDCERLNDMLNAHTKHLSELVGYERKTDKLLEWKKNSFLGRAGRSIEPVVKPLGWDWRIGVATLASFPAREVVVGTMSIVFGLGKDAEDEQQLLEILQKARWNDDPDQPLLFNVPSALSLMVFFALCCQCGSTLMVIRQETGTWFWPAFTFIYMTGLAYIAALLTFQVGMLFL